MLGATPRARPGRRPVGVTIGVVMPRAGRYAPPLPWTRCIGTKAPGLPTAKGAPWWQGGAPMFVREAMTTDVVTATPQTPLVDLIDMMVEHDITGVPVVDADGRVVGVVTEADLVARQAHPPAERPISKVLARIVRGSHDKW